MFFYIKRVDCVLLFIYNENMQKKLNIPHIKPLIITKRNDKFCVDVLVFYVNIFKLTHP